MGFLKEEGCFYQGRLLSTKEALRYYAFLGLIPSGEELGAEPTAYDLRPL